MSERVPSAPSVATVATADSAGAGGPTARAAAEAPAAKDSDRQYIRGSGLLLLGRIVSIFLNLAVQVLAIRYLTKADFGAFAYALAAVSMGSSAIHFGLDKALPRLVPIYYERGDYARTFGSIALATFTIWGLGLSLVLLLFGFRELVAGAVVTDPKALSLLLILIVLAPVGAYTTILEKLVAVFVGAKAIFFRRHVLGPGLKLAAVLTAMLVAGDVYLIAYGYLFGGLIGVWLYAAILTREWRRHGLLKHLHPRNLSLPFRELWGFSLPLQIANFSLIMRGSAVVILLGYFHSSEAVAEYRAVLPIAGLNLLVYEAFRLLFVPHASRMFARNESAAIGELYWKTSIWIAVLTFPVFAITCALAEPLTVALFGADYAGAGTLLAILALGHYFHAALGFNVATLTVHGKLRLVVASDVLAALAVLALSLVLIPRLGALGAAISTTVALILYNVFAHVGLWLGKTGVRLFEWHFVRVYLLTSLLMIGLLAVQWLADPPFYVGVAAAGALSIVVMRLARAVLKPELTFPEMLRIPVIRYLFK